MSIVPDFPFDRYSNKEHNVVLSSQLKIIPDNTRGIFYWIILSEAVFAVIANCLAIRSIIKRKWKFLKKTCLISLAIIDIFTVVIYSINNLEVLSNELMIWTLGEFMCSFVPMAQVFGTTASSLAILIVALDRYQTVNLGKSWNPNRFICIMSAIMLLLICAVLSYPMFTFFNYKALRILDDSKPFPPIPVFQPAHTCIVLKKGPLTMYYWIMAVLIFFPIIVIFVWFYYSIASLIWKHRKPVGTSYTVKSDEESNSSSGNSSNSQLSILKKNNVQVEKKIRTFRIVIALMTCFVLCRLPYWSFYAVRLTITVGGHTGWNAVFALLVLNLMNCVLDPLLYTFLNETLRAFKIFNDFLCKIFCCCSSNDDFEEFEKNNPFGTYAGGHKIITNAIILKPNCKVTFIERSSPSSSRSDNYLPKY